jgi:chromosomal replication initiation ATPase DnaA
MRATAAILTLKDATAFGHSMEQILQAVTKTTRIGRLDIMSAHRAANIMEARHIFYWCARYFTARSYHEIGRFNKRDHCTIMHGVRMLDRDLSRVWPKIKAIAAELGETIDERMAA